MGIAVLIMGESGSGKSTSLRNFEPGEVGIFNVVSKPLPFRKQLPVCNKATYGIINRTLAAPKLNAYVIDDSQALMAFEMFSRAKETGYNKFTEIAVNFYNLVQNIIQNLPPDVIVYFLHHIETTDIGKIKAKTVGKMLDNQLTLEGFFSVVLLCRTDGKRHWLETQSDGFTTAKSPIEMFPLEIDNDLKAVDQAIREYWNLAPLGPITANADNTANATNGTNNGTNPELVTQATQSPQSEKTTNTANAG